MSLGDAYQDDVDRALDASAALAPDPVAPKPRGLWRTAADSLLGAGAKLQASALEVGNVIGPALALSADPSNAEALEAVKRAPDFRQTDQSKPFRDFERKLRPDPVTASKAEEVVYGATGAMATLVGGAVLGGVPGLAAAAGEQGFSASEDLAQQGVDLKTRTAVGALTAGVTGASALLPMAGPTVKATIGLYLAGGPGGFVAQQYATRKILEAADYATIAKQYDPLDPTGLLVSALIPAPFAAWGIRGNLKARKGAPAPAADVPPTTPTQPQDVVDAAMAHNLTLQRDVHEASRPPTIESAPVDPVADSRPPTIALHGSSERFGQFEIMPGRNPALFFSEAGSGRKTQAEHIASGPFGGQLYRVEISQGKKFNPYDDPKAAEIFAQLFPERQNKTIEYPDIYIDSPLIQAMRENGYTRVRVYEPSVQGFSEAVTDTSLVKITATKDMKAGSDWVEVAQKPPEVMPAPRVEGVATVEPAQVTKAKEAAQALQDSGKPLADFAAGAKLEPDVQNLLIGLAEAGKDAQRAARMLGDFTRAVEAQPGRKPVDIAADVVEASREGRTVTPEPQQAPASAGTPEKATAESIQSRIAELEAAAPDMVVRMADDGKPVTLADEMARIRREAAEGTDTELGTNDAGLLKVAAECAMSTGQV